MTAVTPDTELVVTRPRARPAWTRNLTLMSGLTLLIVLAALFAAAR